MQEKEGKTLDNKVSKNGTTTVVDIVEKAETYVSSRFSLGNIILVIVYVFFAQTYFMQRSMSNEILMELKETKQLLSQMKNE